MSVPQSEAERSAARRRARRQRNRVNPSLLVGAALLSAIAVSAGAFSAMPIYRTPWVWLVAGVAWALALGIVWLGQRMRWGVATVALLVIVFIIAVVPLGVPSALGNGPLGLVDGLVDGLATVSLGWKQLLTLTLPVGTYQAIMVPWLLVAMLATALIAALALRGGRLAPWAAVPALLPVAFGVIFGASAVSAPIAIGPLSIAAPRELALWGIVCVAGASWVAWSSGIGRRAALRLGRRAQAAEGAAGVRRNAAVRGLSAVLTAVVALGIGAAAAPLVSSDRQVPRDRVDPQLVVREQTSPLAGYRAAKRDDAFDQAMFSVQSDGEAPHRLRMAVLDGYDGVDFFVADGADGRFTRFPSGEAVQDPVDVTIEIADGYTGIWLPIAPPLAAPPTFDGSRAAALGDAFYVNRSSWAAIAVPSGRGVRSGDAYSAPMSRVSDAELNADPAQDSPLVDLDTMPQLALWLNTQDLPSTSAGLLEAIQRLRDRGYLSHSLTDGEGERAWLERAADEYGTKFIASAGGHSVARIEALFTQLNEQERAAGSGADDRALVSGIGDDEQFAAAAALIARAMGFDSRVVLGVRLGDEQAGVPGVPACSETCTGENLAAWVEVRGDTGDWAPIDASPQLQVPPSTLERGEQLPEFPTVPEERDASQADPPTGTSGDSGDPSETPERDSFAALWPILKAIGLSILALVLLALPVLFLPVAKRIRAQRRRRAGTAEERALGAWDELIDGYADTGRTAPANLGRRDTLEVLQVPSAQWISWTVDRAVYAREGISDLDADQLWALVDDELAARRASLGFWRRLSARYSLRSLLPKTRIRQRLRLPRRFAAGGR
ncbi:transglutaminase domain-containing protein [Leucobacter japonicus]|uniref:transglutaminase domain-containing protein n=1 Tax=Leucobacter japonicus TaxID=1461259 RepID=UPI0009499539|nr:transglutaminase domain-containing protein [Leucobacter japonicus]